VPLPLSLGKVQIGKWTAKGIYFVTLLKDNASYRTVKNLSVPKRGNIISDKIIKLTGVRADEKCPYLLRRIVIWDEENQRQIVLLTNHLDFGPTTIAAIYKDRWEIELFFKALKQNLKVKSFVGTSENALRIQIWTALIAILILKWLHYISKAGWTKPRATLNMPRAIWSVAFMTGHASLRSRLRRKR
jgi:IS4 transposase